MEVKEEVARHGYLINHSMEEGRVARALQLIVAHQICVEEVIRNHSSFGDRTKSSRVVEAAALCLQDKTPESLILFNGTLYDETVLPAHKRYSDALIGILSAALKGHVKGSRMKRLLQTNYLKEDKQLTEAAQTKRLERGDALVQLLLTFGIVIFFDQFKINILTELPKKVLPLFIKSCTLAGYTTRYKEASKTAAASLARLPGDDVLVSELPTLGENAKQILDQLIIPPPCALATPNSTDPTPNANPTETAEADLLENMPKTAIGPLESLPESAVEPQENLPEPAVEPQHNMTEAAIAAQESLTETALAPSQDLPETVTCPTKTFPEAVVLVGMLAKDSAQGDAAPDTSEANVDADASSDVYDREFIVGDEEMDLYLKSVSKFDNEDVE